MMDNLPPMPKTEDRRPYDEEAYPSYLEGDTDWASNNPEALTWLADNHVAIRKALEGSAATIELLKDKLEKAAVDAEAYALLTARYSGASPRAVLEIRLRCASYRAAIKGLS